MKVDRYLNFYQKDGEKLLFEVQITLTLKQLKIIFDENIQDDPKLYKTFNVNEEQYDKLKNEVVELSSHKFDKFDVYYECFTIEN